MGTATYFSPEQAQGRSVDARSDLYSLGAVLFEMVVGRPPFKGDTPLAVAIKHVQEQPPSPRALGANMAESLEAITLKLLAKNPDNRYPSADDLRADLRRYREGMHSLRRAAAASVAVGHGCDAGSRDRAVQYRCAIAADDCVAERALHDVLRTATREPCRHGDRGDDALVVVDRRARVRIRQGAQQRRRPPGSDRYRGPQRHRHERGRRHRGDLGHRVFLRRRSSRSPTTTRPRAWCSSRSPGAGKMAKPTTTIVLHDQLGCRQ